MRTDCPPTNASAVLVLKAISVSSLLIVLGDTMSIIPEDAAVASSSF